MSEPSIYLVPRQGPTPTGILLSGCWGLGGPSLPRTPCLVTPGVSKVSQPSLIWGALLYTYLFNRLTLRFVQCPSEKRSRPLINICDNAPFTFPLLYQTGGPGVDRKGSVSRWSLPAQKPRPPLSVSAPRPVERPSVHTVVDCPESAPQCIRGRSTVQGSFSATFET